MKTSSVARSFSLSLSLTASAVSAQSSGDATLAGPTSTTRQAVRPPVSAADAAARLADERALERLMASLASETRERRLTWLAVGVGGGALVTGIGVWMLARADAPPWSENPGSYAVTFGGALLLGGSLGAALPSQFARVNEAWETSAGLPVAARRAQVGAALDEAAVLVRRGRRTAGWLSVGLGTALVGVGTVLYALRDEPLGGFSSSEGLTGFGGVIMVALGVYTLTVPSPIETARQFWDAGEARSSVRLAGVSLLPTRGGALAGLALTF